MPAQMLLSNPVSHLFPAGIPAATAPAPAASAPAPAATAPVPAASAPVRAASAPAPAVAEASGPAPAPGSAQPRQLRLTRRGRLVFIGLPLMLTAAAALTVLGFFTAPAMASGGAPDPTQTVEISVGAGDSLWGLAEEFVPDRDPRDVVADIMELNNLSGDRVAAGVRLFIPVNS